MEVYKVIINQKDMTRLYVDYDKYRSEFIFTFFNDAIDSEATVRVKDIQGHVVQTFEKFRDDYVNGKSKGRIELLTSAGSQTNQNTLKLSKEGVLGNYYTISSGVFNNGIELDLVLSSSNYYEPERSDLDVIIYTLRDLVMSK